MYPANSVDVHVLLRTVVNVKLKLDAIGDIVIQVMARYNPPPCNPMTNTNRSFVLSPLL